MHTHAPVPIPTPAADTTEYIGETVPMAATAASLMFAIHTLSMKTLSLVTRYVRLTTRDILTIERFGFPSISSRFSSTLCLPPFSLMFLRYALTSKRSLNDGMPFFARHRRISAS